MKYGLTIFVTDDAMTNPDLAREADAGAPLRMLDRLPALAAEAG